MNQNLVAPLESVTKRHGNVLASDDVTLAIVDAGVTKTFMFTDIVSSTHLAGSLGDSTWLGVIAWHDRTLRAAFAEHGGVEVRHTGDGFFVAFDSAQAALACAVDIQRRLETNRHEHGSALTVRIGLHLASALRHLGDYAGQGVHVAAHVAALGERGEIVASRTVVKEVGGAAFNFSAARTVSVKGVTEPVEVHTVEWDTVNITPDNTADLLTQNTFEHDATGDIEGLD